MARERSYSLDRKIARYLQDVHGIKADVEDGCVRCGAYVEKMIVVSRRALDRTAECIREAGQHG